MDKKAILDIIATRRVAVTSRVADHEALMLMWDNGLCANLEWSPAASGFENATIFHISRGWNLPKITNGKGEVAMVVTVEMARKRALDDLDNAARIIEAA